MFLIGFEQFPDFDPRKDYGLSLADAELTLEERAVASSTGSTALGVDDIKLKM